MKKCVNLRVAAMFIFLLTFVLAGCKPPLEEVNPLIGSWEGTFSGVYEIMVLNADGTYTVDGTGPVTIEITGTWSSDSEAQTITTVLMSYIFNGTDLGWSNMESTSTYQLSEDSNTLTLTNEVGAVLVYTRM